jgi:hypothetical protein
MSPSPQALEQSLFKLFDVSAVTLDDLEGFNALVQPVFEKLSAIKAMRQYLIGSASCPRILGALVYSTQGRSEVIEWLSMGMPIKLLYQCMMADGGGWSKVGVKLPLEDLIISGGPEWDFDYKWVNGFDHGTAIPGLLEAVLKRALHQGHEALLLQGISLETLEKLLIVHPDLLVALCKKARITSLASPEQASIPDIAQEIIKILLDPVQSIQKVLLRRAY